MRALYIRLSNRGGRLLREIAERERRSERAQALHMLERSAERILANESWIAEDVPLPVADGKIYLEFSERLINQIWECGQRQALDFRQEATYLLETAIASYIEDERMARATTLIDYEDRSFAHSLTAQ